jgi:BirA family biotin operon repressor/biotin-[acetyl-CoA-carboxylase] ligase
VTTITALPAPAPILRRQERFASVESTNDVIRSWLAGGEPEVCVAVADEQTAGRGRSGRTWTAPAGRGLLVSLGFRPTWLEPDRVWRLAATVSLAMAEAAEDASGLRPGTIRLKWPNDLVIAVDGGGAAIDAARLAAVGRQASVRKLGGVLGETDGLGTIDPRAVVGIGLNADWRAADFPDELRATMTSLRAVAGDRSIDTADLLDEFLARLEARLDAFHGGSFDASGWAGRQVTTGRRIEILLADGAMQTVLATGVNAVSGALRIADRDTLDGERSIVVGEIVHVRLAGM